jgi:hypothetical protein
LWSWSVMFERYHVLNKNSFGYNRCDTSSSRTSATSGPVTTWCGFSCFSVALYSFLMPSWASCLRVPYQIWTISP